MVDSADLASASVAQLPHALSSPTPALLKSNGAPSDTEAAAIRLFLSRTEEELARINAVELVCGVDALALSLRATYQDFLEGHRAILSPVRQLPAELLAKIFQDTEGPPLSIGQVCGRWRSIALSTPQLWSTLPYLVLDSVRSHGEGFAKFYHLYLRRSREALLSVSLFIMDNWSEHNPLIDALVGCAHRWRKCNITSAFHSLHILDAVRGCLTSLQTLHLTLSGRTPGSPVDIFEIAPRLRSVKLGNMDSRQWIKLPWSQLNWYNANLMGVGATLDTLRLAPHLTECHLMMPVRSFESPGTSTLVPVTLDGLQSLHLYDPLLPEDAVRSNALLSHLHLPAMTEIRVRVPYNSSVVGPIISLVSRSSCSLQRLYILSTTLGEGALLRLLSLTPHLVHLSVCDMTSSDLTKLIISPADTEPPLIPYLKHLTIQYPYSNTCEALTNVIHSRYDYPSASNEMSGCGDHKYPRNLQTVRLVCRNSIACEEMWDKFHGWCERTDPKARKLLWCKDQLNAKFFGKEPLKEKDMVSVDRFFATIEENQPIGLQYLCFTDINTVMHQISLLDPRTIPHNDSYRFSDRARTLMADWKPLLDAFVQAQRWFLDSNFDFAHVLFYRAQPYNGNAFSPPNFIAGDRRGTHLELGLWLEGE